MIAPFWSDMDLTNRGGVFLNQSEDRAVITWDGIGSFLAPNVSFTFQAQLMANKRIIFGYNGVADTVSNLDEDLVVGLSRGFGTGEAVRIVIGVICMIGLGWQQWKRQTENSVEFG